MVAMVARVAMPIIAMLARVASNAVSNVRVAVVASNGGSQGSGVGECHPRSFPYPINNPTTTSFEGKENDGCST